MAEIYAYDIECFKYDSLVVMKDLDNNIVGCWWSAPPGEFPEDSPNGFEGVREFIQGKTLIGYNNHHYDDLMITAMMAGEPQKRLKILNDAIIAGDDNITRAWSKRASDLDTVDTMQQIDVSMPSLKQIEGNMGRSIIESVIPFNIDRPLTDAEKQEVLQYCAYDVETTIRVYRLREEYFNSKNYLLSMLPERSRLRNPSKLNTTTLSADILLGKPLPKWAQIRLPDQVRKTPEVPDNVWDMWTAAERTNDREILDTQVTVKAYDCDISFGFGGLHGVASQGREFTNVMLLDVGSMYPSIIVNLQALGETGTELYDELRQERLRIKKSDPLRASALKLILNSVYGNLKNQYSILNNPLASVSVCVYGQLALFDLARRLYNTGYTVMNLNTDGVGFVDHRGLGDRWKDVQREWEKVYNLNLELDRFARWIQKDVNNYVAVGEDGHIKVKGGECNKYAEDKLFSNNNVRITHMALVDQLLKDVPVWKTVRAHLDEPYLYQYVLKAGKTYRGVVDQTGKMYQNVNRVFAVKPCDEAVRLYKLRVDGGMVNFPDMPDNMLVWNGEVDEIRSRFRDIVDIEHYCSVVEKKLEGWR